MNKDNAYEDLDLDLTDPLNTLEREIDLPLEGKEGFIAIPLQRKDITIEDLDVMEQGLESIKYQKKNISNSKYKVYLPVHNEVDDVELKDCRRINELRAEYNKDIDELLSEITLVENETERIIEPVYKAIQSCVFDYEEIKEPSKGVLYFGYFLMIYIIGFIVVKNYHKSVAEYEEKVAQQEKRFSEFKLESENLLTDITQGSINRYNVFSDTPKNNLSTLQSKFNSIKKRYDDMFNEYRKYTNIMNDDYLLYEILKIVEMRRANNLQDAINLHLQDKHQSNVEYEVRKQTNESRRQSEIMRQQEDEMRRRNELQSQQLNEAKKQTTEIKKQTKIIDKQYKKY